MFIINQIQYTLAYDLAGQVHDHNSKLCRIRSPVNDVLNICQNLTDFESSWLIFNGTHPWPWVAGRTCRHNVMSTCNLYVLISSGHFYCFLHQLSFPRAHADTCQYILCVNLSAMVYSPGCRFYTYSWKNKTVESLYTSCRYRITSVANKDCLLTVFIFLNNNLKARTKCFISGIWKEL